MDTARKKPVKSKKSNVIASKKRFSLTSGQKKAVFVVAILAVAGIGYAGYGAFKDYRAQATAFQTIGVHPQASVETTDTARNIKALVGWNGKIYAGYGDWDANTGPMSVTPYDPTTGKFAATPEFVADTEAVDIFSVIEKKLYAVHVDPRGGIGATYSVADNSTGTPVWTNVTGKVPYTHAFGITAGTSPGEMFIAGQRDEGSASNEVAKIYRTTDGGATWSESLSVPSRGGYNRMMFIAKLGNSIYAQRMSMADFTGTDPQKEAWVWTGSRWSSVTPINAYYPYKGTEFAGKLIMKSSTNGGYLLSYDGRTTTTLRSSIRDYVVGDDGYLYVLGYQNNSLVVVRTKDLVSWENVSYAPLSTSITYLNNTLYLGGFDGQMYRSEINPNVIDSTPPTVSLIGPADGYTWTSNLAYMVANASDAGGIKKVEFYVGSNFVGYTTSTNIDAAAKLYPGSYTIRWNGTGVPAGTYDLKAVAYDTYGNATTSNSVKVTIPEGLTPVDTTSPTVSIVAPTASTRNIRKSVNVSATAADNIGIAYMEVQVDGKTVAYQNSTSTSIYTSAVPLTKGTHTVVVIAKDAAGNVNQATQTFSSR